MSLSNIQPFKAAFDDACGSTPASMDPPLQTLAANDLLDEEAVEQTEVIPDDTPDYRRDQPFDSLPSDDIPGGSPDQDDSVTPHPPSATETEKPSSSLMPPPPPPCKKQDRMNEIRWGVTKYPKFQTTG